MMSHLPVLIVVIPLMTALCTPLIALFSPRVSRLVVVIVLLATGACAAGALLKVLQSGAWHYALGGWAPPWGIEYVIDPLSALLAVLIVGMALLVFWYAQVFNQVETPGREGIFTSLLLLLVTGLLGMVVTGDVFNLYVFLEISSLSAYALLASGGIRATVATFRYLIVGTIAATFYLLGIGYLYALTGTLNMADLATRLPAVMGTNACVVAITFIVVGLAIKAALFPLHGWLPDTYTYAPAPVSGFIAAVMAKVSAYALLRILYFIMHATGVANHVLTLLSWTAVVAIVAGSVMALAQHDIRRMLAYSSVGQMGYIVLGMTLGTTAGMIGALLHVVSHAVMKGCLFLIVGGIQWRTGICQIHGFAGMGQRLPWTMAAFVVAALSMIGLPPTLGFFSKWYLLTGALAVGAWVPILVLLVSSLFSAVYFFRIFEYAYLRQPETSRGELARVPGRQELPANMLAPILVLAGVLLILGLLNNTLVTQVIQRALPHALL